MAPLVSCVMITAGRPELVGQSTRYFLRQDHPERELVIIHEDPADLPADMPRDARVRPAIVPRGLSLGEKRNEAARLARGSILVHWDDDDWHAPCRIGHQIAPIVLGHADITGLSGTLFFEPATWTFWACRPDLFARMFVNDVHGGTLAYRREVWLDLAKFPPRSLREDADFMVDAMSRGARLARLPADDTYLYVRHGANTWRFEAGRCLDPGAWARVAEPPGFAGDRAFYERMRAATGPAGRSRPLVSCIMPTFERPAFVARAARHFLRQRYADRELVVVDDGAISAEPSLPRDDRVRYHRLPARASIGAKRNVACEIARGEVILHWDDDDWMAPRWIETQVEALTRTGADVVGLSRPYFYDPAGRRAWRYEYPARGRPWVHGGTLCYTKGLWRRTPFADTNLGEDVRFLWSREPKRVVSHDRGDGYVAYVHDRNASKKPGGGALWRPCPAHEVERLWVAAAKDSGA